MGSSLMELTSINVNTDRDQFGFEVAISLCIATGSVK
jgi:hypothetical protein